MLLGRGNGRSGLPGMICLSMKLKANQGRKGFRPVHESCIGTEACKDGSRPELETVYLSPSYESSSISIKA